ncbi:DUF6022 family protein [Paenibacillus sp. SC116]|uniref:DUF6022 family protein n=1 Tax=Paenibacillus sp. SC116 TaxID=2968986 RepID=UPI00215A5E29|nr:DUF6022 family protein [Paenibacillus sp. SC116]MCR8842421.1 DUF6022 family protein [Paenibacillus sp. SC116]
MMKRIELFQKDMTIVELGEAANKNIAFEWKGLYDSLHEQLTTAFAEIEDAAYGVYLDQLMTPLFEQLEAAGFSLMEELKEDDFVIAKCLIFRNSLEKWGTEDNRSRIFWSVVRDESGQPMGTLLTEIPHSHLKFDIPSAPVIYSIEVSDKERIVQEMRRIKDAGSQIL